jgi:hypothetical protein
MLVQWLRRRRRRFWNRSNPKSAIPNLKSDDPRLEIYLDQIADLPAPDRAIIVDVLRQILAEETAYEQRVLDK